MSKLSRSERRHSQGLTKITHQPDRKKMQIFAEQKTHNPGEAKQSIPLCSSQFGPECTRFCQNQNGIPAGKISEKNSSPFWSFLPILAEIWWFQPKRLKHNSSGQNKLLQTYFFFFFFFFEIPLNTPLFRAFPLILKTTPFFRASQASFPFRPHSSRIFFFGEKQSRKKRRRGRRTLQRSIT